MHRWMRVVLFFAEENTSEGRSVQSAVFDNEHSTSMFATWSIRGANRCRLFFFFCLWSLVYGIVAIKSICILTLTRSTLFCCTLRAFSVVE